MRKLITALILTLCFTHILAQIIKPNTTVCYDFVGCFDNNYPFNNTGYFLPNSPESIDTEFLLYTRSNRNTEQIISYKSPAGIRRSYFNRNLPLKVIVHGFGNTKWKPWIHEMKDAFLDIDNFNVIIVGWGNGASFPYYNNASTNIRLVGRELGLMINAIADTFYQTDPQMFRIHCIGHSLGAHLCGHAGIASNIKFDRISGLDPANQFFENMDPVVRLDKTDAKYVDAIHTSCGSLLTGSFGIIQPVGHIDFYVNGGSFQPGCPPMTSIITGVFSSSFDPSSDLGCSHNRVMKYFTESIKTRCAFQAFKCDSFAKYQNGECMSCERDSCSILGYYADGFKASGTFYLATARDEPWCGDQYLFEMKLSKNFVKTGGEITMDLDTDSSNQLSIQITSPNDDLKPDTYIRKFFVSRRNVFVTKNDQIRFIVKTQSWIGSWIGKPFEPKFSYDKIRIVNIETGETEYYCAENTIIEQGTPAKFQTEDLESC